MELPSAKVIGVSKNMSSKHFSHFIKINCNDYYIFVLFHSIFLRCAAKCHTSADGRSIKFTNLNHNHGQFTLSKIKPKDAKSSKENLLVKVKTEKNP